MTYRVAIALLVCMAVTTIPVRAQCSFPADGPGRSLNYTFEPTVTSSGTVLHVGLEFQSSHDAEQLETPTEWAGETLHGVRNLRALSADTDVSSTTTPGVETIRHTRNQPVALAYDIVRDWTGRFRHPAEFHGTLLPEYLELTGDNALAHPKLSADAMVTVHFDWRNLPTGWVLATSFGTTAGSDGRCQSYSGKWSAVQQALFTAGVFRIHHFRIGAQPAVLAIRDQWTFSDEQAIAAIQKAVSVVRDFWRDHNFPYFLVTLKQFDNESGNGDGSAFNNAFWLYLSRRDSISDQMQVLIHESFHIWDPRRMGATSTPEDWKAIEWFREGFVSYYGYLLALRAGFIALPEYMESVNRDLRMLPASSSGYVRGRILALWLDCEIRKDSGGKKSLDNFMRDMVDKASRPLTETRIIETAGRSLSPASRNELARVVQPASPIPVPKNALGSCARGTVDNVPTFDLGFDLNTSMARGNIAGVEPDGPAFSAGIRDGQRLSGRLSVYNNQPEKPAIVTVETGAGPKTIQYYPRGNPISVMQFHLDQATHEANPGSCKIPMNQTSDRVQ